MLIRSPLVCLQECSTVVEVAPESHAWVQLARSHPAATIFHQPEWAQVIGRTYGLRPHYFLLPRGGGEASGLPFFQAGRLLRRRLISLPFSDVAGPLLAHPQDEPLLMAAACRTAQTLRINHVEVRGGLEGAPHGFECSEEFCTFVVDLAPEPDLLRRHLQKSTTQRSLRVAERGPLTIRFGQNEADVRAFHRLNLVTRRRHGVPPQPFRLFRNMWEVLSPLGRMSVLLAELGGTPVAGMILFHFRDTAYYKYGASDPDHLKLRPNHLLMWRAITWAREQGYRYFDLGRTYLGNDGLMRFKQSWGASQVSLAYWRYPPVRRESILAEGSPGYEFVTRYWRRLPLWATEVGSLFYKHFA